MIDAAYPQWACNGHNVLRALVTVRDLHTSPVARSYATEAVMLVAGGVEIVREQLERTFWTMRRAEVKAQERERA